MTTDEPKINPDNPLNLAPAAPLTDAEVVADFAIQALRGGRYELARVLTNLAAQAARAQAHAIPAPVMVPMVGQTRDERPIGPTGNGDRDLAAAAAQTEIFGDQTRQLAVPANGRCVAWIDGSKDTCNAVAYWERAGGPDSGVWRHVDPALDNDHPAVVENWVQGTH